MSKQSEPDFKYFKRVLKGADGVKIDIQESELAKAQGKMSQEGNDAKAIGQEQRKTRSTAEAMDTMILELCASGAVTNKSKLNKLLDLSQREHDREAGCWQITETDTSGFYSVARPHFYRDQHGHPKVITLLEPRIDHSYAKPWYMANPQMEFMYNRALDIGEGFQALFKK